MALDSFVMQLLILAFVIGVVVVVSFATYKLVTLYRKVNRFIDEQERKSLEKAKEAK
ncbi:MAG: hypothetical protein M1587_11510 [Thaumarchaeota archaeon]|nr:hypothetical protein [Nitrososphaerota archaeon]